MKYFQKHRNALNFVKALAMMLTTWPLDRNSGRVKFFIYKSLRWFFLVFSVLHVPTFLMGLYYFYGDFMNFMKSMSEVVYICELTFNLIWCTVQEPKLQILISEMEQFDKVATPQQMTLRNKYLKDMSKAFPIMTIIFVVGAFFFILSPVMTKRAVPLNTIYFLPVEEDYWAKCLAYTMNNLAITLAMNTIAVDYMVITMLSFASFKFDYIGQLFRNASNRKMLRRCVRKHQDALRFASGIQDTAQQVVTKSLAGVFLNMIACSLLILNNVRFFELTQFLLVTILSSIRLYMVSWSANIMTDVAEDLSKAIYDSPWIYKSVEMRWDVIIILHRCQTPVVLTIQGLAADLSMRFYSIVLYKVFSYFMTLRAILRV